MTPVTNFVEHLHLSLDTLARIPSPANHRTGKPKQRFQPQESAVNG
ncbi:hypothetical protein [Phormidium sp. CCY1219]|nr:hypothetical protein [Phormidium sp. CCY1219]MEB3828191.1 hypothetical protein [Phormidium sp. CCY1219]